MSQVFPMVNREVLGGILVECADFPGNHIDMMGQEPVFPEHPVKLSIAVELLHLHRVVNNVPFAPYRYTIITFGDREYLEVEIRA